MKDLGGLYLCQCMFWVTSMENFTPREQAGLEAGPWQTRACWACHILVEQSLWWWCKCLLCLAGDRPCQKDRPWCGVAYTSQWASGHTDGEVFEHVLGWWHCVQVRWRGQIACRTVRISSLSFCEKDDECWMKEEGDSGSVSPIYGQSLSSHVSHLILPFCPHSKWWCGLSRWESTFISTRVWWWKSLFFFTYGTEYDTRMYVRVWLAQSMAALENIARVLLLHSWLIMMYIIILLVKFNSEALRIASSIRASTYNGTYMGL